jgi:hypothetical protein
VFRSAGAAAQPHFQSSRIAFLIAAHTDPSMLARLVRALAAPWAHVFIHIDAKADIDAFIPALSDNPDVTLIRNRVAVHWGGWSQVEASLRLIGAALEHDPSFARFVLLSGMCYPLTGNAALRDFLLAGNTEHIGAVRMPSVEREKPLTRLTRWHFEGGDRTSGGKAACLRLLNRIAQYGPPRDAMKALEGFAPYAGSSWWALTQEAVLAIRQAVDAHPGLVEFFRHSAFPDESFFHTILANTFAPDRLGASLTFADWSPGPERPHAISERHLAQLLDPGPKSEESAGPFFFARKFSTRNSDLLDRIDAARRDAIQPADRAAVAAA